MDRLCAFVAVVALAACAQTEIAGAHVTGVFTAIHSEDVRAAIAAANSAQPKQNGKIYEVHVISSTEMHIYREPRTHLISYQIARKVGGKWNADERAVVVTE
jgi:uncharacterized protein YbjT (DUF2867 family)